MGRQSDRDVPRDNGMIERKRNRKNRERERRLRKGLAEEQKSIRNEIAALIFDACRIIQNVLKKEENLKKDPI